MANLALDLLPLLLGSCELTLCFENRSGRIVGL